jgi:CubicO group peptidase (beta-lactamase class C family)
VFSAVSAGEFVSRQRKSIGTWLWRGLLALLLLIVGLLLWKRPDNALRIATASIADGMCSGVFVEGMSPERTFAERFATERGLRPLLRGLHYAVDRANQRVTADWHGHFVSISRYYPSYGCALPWQTPDVATLQAAHEAVATAETQPIVISPDPRLGDALNRAFAEPATGARRHVHAIVIMHEGHIIAERYAPGFGPATPLLAYSVSKSVVNALVGILVRQGRLDVHISAPVAAWRNAGDPRHVLTLDNLLRMTSGLALTEDDSGFDPVSIMLFQKPDMAAYAAAAPLRAKPGNVWDYSSGNTLIVAGVLRDAVGGGAAGMIRFAHRELFDPIGMRNVRMEFDGAQTLIGSTRIYASARDWARFGQLYLDDGLANGRRILPAGWAIYSASPTLDAPYGAGFWSNVAAPGDKAPRIDGLPPDAYFASGMNGQRIVIVPSKRLVIVRFGSTVDPPRFDMKGLVRLVADVSTTVQ